MMHGTTKDFEVFLNKVMELFQVYPVRDYAKKVDKKCLLHLDVDHYFEKAVEIAEIIREAGISATFFMLHTEPYYKHPDFLEICLDIQKMGHEIGLHNNILDQCIHTGENPLDVLKTELSYLRDAGLNIEGTCAHGTVTMRNLNYRNYEIFKECVPPYLVVPRERINVPLYQISLEDHGLYEANYLPQLPEYLFEDSHGEWHIIHKNLRDIWHPTFPKYVLKYDPTIALKKLADRPDINTIQLVTHPWWWRV